MLRSLKLALSLAALASLATAAVLTDNLGQSKRVSLEKIKLADAALWDEYGLAEAETAKYEGAAKPFTVTAWRMKDPTGAQAAFRWQRPTGAKPGNEDALYYSPAFAVAAASTVLMMHGNYLLRFEGAMPVRDELKILLFQLPKVDQSSLPPVLEYVPKQGFVDGSDRFIGGPAALERFFPKLSPSAVAFHFGVEAIVARYKTGAAETEMGLFYYPTNQIARDREEEFRKVSGMMVKRSGPLVAAVMAPGDANDAERLLAQVTYKAQVTLNQTKSAAQNAGEMLVAIFQLIGLLLSLAALAGFMVFAMRRLRVRAAGGKEQEPMTMLHLEDRDRA